MPSYAQQPPSGGSSPGALVSRGWPLGYVWQEKAEGSLQVQLICGVTHCAFAEHALVCVKGMHVVPVDVVLVAEVVVDAVEPPAPPAPLVVVPPVVCSTDEPQATRARSRRGVATRILPSYRIRVRCVIYDRSSSRAARSTQATTKQRSVYPPRISHFSIRFARVNAYSGSTTRDCAGSFARWIVVP